MDRQPSATVVICTRNRAIVLAQCLEAVCKLDYSNFEVLVVDNGSTDETAEVARRYGAGYLFEPTLGLSRARNAGARNATSELVAYIDDDAVPHAGWLAALAREFADPDVMAVGGDYQLSGTAQVSGKYQRLVADNTHEYWLAICAFGGIGSGSSMAFRRAAFNSWAGFDERFGRGSIIPTAEEHLAFVELCSLGYRCVYSPDAVVYHPYSTDPYEAGVAYALMLLHEHKELRGELLRHILRSFTSRERIWRRHRPVVEGGEAPLRGFSKLQAILSGIRQFYRASRISRAKSPLLCAIPSEAAPRS